MSLLHASRPDRHPGGGDALDDPLSIETTRIPRADRSLPAVEDEDEGKAAVELASIMTAVSNPVTPGPSSPPLDQLRLQDFVPPTRPSSTPFPQPEHRSPALRCLSCPADDDPDEPARHLDDHGPRSDSSAAPPAAATADLLPHPPPPVGKNLNDLPAEIHECILDHLFGFRVSSASKSSVTRWGTALRHSRRKELSRLALVSPAWRVLIQERLYRHIKLKATVPSVNDALVYFARHPHLRPYVRHVEIWFPVFQPRFSPLALSSTNALPTVTAEGLTSASYVLPADNCSLEEIFYFVGATFPVVSVLTLEGGDRRKAPKIRHFLHHGGGGGCGDRDQGHQPAAIPPIPTVRTLVCRGQWNLIRSREDFEAIAAALPNLREWHGSYSRPKSKSYLTMASVLPRLPAALRNLTTLHLCLESDYRRELGVPPYALKVASRLHFCPRLAQACPALERLSYTGRVCAAFFDVAAALAAPDPRATRLRSVDLTVKNCCRHPMQWIDGGSGITNMSFIRAFEALVLAGVRSLAKLKNLEDLRIRYVDLDSPVPPLNPYFTLTDGWCSGVWSYEIVEELSRVRPSARFAQLAESFGEVGYNKDGRITVSPEFPGLKAPSLKISNYELLMGISIT